tara:strand:- start:50 stop:2662 length:2613 start_codon:yes stop_codon:yes gene_type:complete
MELQELIENYFAPTKENFSFDTLLEMVEQVLDLDTLPLTEEKELSSGKKFVLSLPRYSPSEAWGDPETMDRQQINNIFKVVRGGTSIPARIQYLNDFLNPEKAKRKTSPRVIINTMIIIESLKAAMNHFNEASAGFVFEAFMAALTGGHQEAGRIKGTLPIEDFVAFSQFGGKNIPVSLKLLGKSTGVKGSFTNLVDFLFVRGEPAIKYLVAYKTYEGGDKAAGDKGSVGALEIWEFDITRENLTSFLAGGSRKTKMLLGDVSPEALRAAIASNDMQQIAALFTAAPGYTKRGMLYKEIPPPEAVKTPPVAAPIAAESLTFHQREKLMMEEEKLMAEGKGEDPSQWEVSFTMIQNLGAAVNLQGHGTLDFTEEKFDAIAEIYAKILEGRVVNLLDGVQNLTTNIGEYFASRQRKTAIQHGQQAVKDTEVVKDSLEEEIGPEETVTSPETALAEAVRPHLNKYDPGSLLGQVVHLLEKEGLMDAAASVREVSSVVSQAWVNKNLPPETDPHRPDPVTYLEEKKKLNPDTLLEIVARVMDEEEKPNLQVALDVIQSKGYDHTQKGNQIKVLDDNRDAAREDITKALEPHGFILNMLPSAGSMGRLEVKDRQKGNVYIYFKPKSRRSAACAGSDYEDKLACSLQSLGLQADTAGSGHGSDLTIVGPKATMSVEAKTAMGADFGQFTYQYDPSAASWSVRRTAPLVKSGNEELFTGLFNELVRDYLNKNARIPLGDPRLKVDKKTGKIYGIKGSETTGEFKRELQASWFGKTDVKVSFEFSRIADFYAKKGDQYIQIGKKGLYALTPDAAQALDIPLFAETGLTPELRVRFKPSMGENSGTAFNVAVKIKGSLAPSPVNLENPTDVQKIRDLVS